MMATAVGTGPVRPGTGAAGPSSVLERDHVRHLDL
jgi:hypothetical protein